MNKYYLIILMMFSSGGFATTMTDLVNDQQVIVKSYIDNNSPIVGEQVVLTIDISTRLAFSQGTKIHHFDMPNTLVMKQGTFAINSIKHINGHQYVNQLWEIPLFLQGRDGNVIPAIAVEMGVKFGEENIVGKVLTERIPLNASMPSPYMIDEFNWLVASNATLEETINILRVEQQEDDFLRVGDAIERKIVLKANGSVAMLFPQLIKEADYKNEAGRVYLTPSEYLDKENRGIRTSKHIEKMTFAIEKPGLVLFPEVEVVWWDTASNSEQRLVLASQEFRVKHTLSSFIKMYWPMLLLVLSLVIGLVMLGIHFYKKVQYLKATNNMPVSYKFMQALFEKEWGKAESAIYQQLKTKHQKDTLTLEKDNGEWRSKAVDLQKQRYKKTGENKPKRAFFVRLWKEI